MTAWKYQPGLLDGPGSEEPYASMRLSEHLPGKHSQATHGKGAGAMAAGAATFAAAGAKVKRVTPANADQAMAMHEQTQKALERRKPFGPDSGDEYTRRALGQGKSREDVTVLVAQAGTGHIAGAISYSTDRGKAYIHYLGSTGIVRGTGSALVRRVFADAASKGLGVNLGADLESLGFWKNMGLSSTGPPGYGGVTPMSISAAGVKVALRG